MKIIVNAKTRSKNLGIREAVVSGAPEGDVAYFSVSVHAAPVDGKANEEIRKLLARYYGVTVSSVRLIAGASSKRKIFNIDK